MSWSERLEEIRKTQNRQGCLPAKGSKGAFGGFAGEQEEHIPEFSRMPNRAELERICRRAVADYPDVSADHLLAFLVEAQDPQWATERVARHLARRMSEGLIRWEPEMMR